MDTKRTVAFTVSLTPDEAEDLKRIAAMNGRTPGDELRHLLRETLGVLTRGGQ